MTSDIPLVTEEIFSVCEAFCEKITALNTPCGVAVTLPFSYFGEPSLTVYVITHPDGTMHIEESGETISKLESLGLDLNKGYRKEIIKSYSSDNNVFFNEDEFLFCSQAFLPDHLGSRLISFTEFMIGIQRISFLTRKNVEDIFREEVVNAILLHFSGDAEVVVDSKEISKIFPDTRVDLVVRSTEAPPLAVFLGTSETKALEALLLWSELKGSSADTGNVMLILNQLRPHAVTAKTLSRASQRFPVSYYNDNLPDSVFDPMNRLVFNTRIS